MENKAILLDRDGVINKDKGYVYRIKDLEFLPNVFEGLRKSQKEYKLIIVTNQSGIAMGYYTEKDYLNFREEMHKRLKEENIIITAEYFCPHHPEGKIEKYKAYCNCRKPQAGMLEQAARDFNLNLSKCWMIGNSERDIVAGIMAGCRTIRILEEKKINSVIYADFVTQNLLKAAHYILHNNNK